jgi:hypothetical protein
MFVNYVSFSRWYAPHLEFIRCVVFLLVDYQLSLYQKHIEGLYHFLYTIILQSPRQLDCYQIATIYILLSQNHCLMSSCSLRKYLVLSLGCAVTRGTLIIFSFCFSCAVAFAGSDSCDFCHISSYLVVVEFAF